MSAEAIVKQFDSELMQAIRQVQAYVLLVAPYNSYL